MEVNALKSVDTSVGTFGAIQPNAAVKKTENQPTEQKQDVNGKEVINLNKDQLNELTAAMNKFMESLSADLQFAVHEKTQQLMVRLVDVKNQRVIKEFPSHEFLDTMARIRENIGAFLEKRA